ncbi:MAG: hypothetical protein H6719_37690 [Sandaracinaceae bacterium]|nr:hypothetical protein [Sandaracinaceae bacterium]
MSEEGDAVARALILDHELVVGGRALRVEEAEAYLWSATHRDPFAHRDPRQAAASRWYFHRVGGSYRGGSFKGLDLTFGPPDTFGGVLIRSLRDGAELVCGPSRCVDHLLALAGARSVAELDDGRDAFDPAGRLQLRPAPRERALLRTARVGLTLKRHVEGDGRPRWLLVPDRFLTDPRAVSKGRVHAVIALHQAGLDPRAIRERTGSQAVDRYLARYAEGWRDPSFDRFVGRALADADYAELHGIWTRTYGSDTIAS